MKKISTIPYHGGKSIHLNHILPQLPMTGHYCEPFGGSAAVLINRPISRIETYNDLNHEVVRFFRVIREQPHELIRLLALTPYSREEFTNCIKSSDDCSSLEKARQLYVRIEQSRNSVPCPTPGNWSYSRASGGVSSSWLNKQINIFSIANRLSKVQIENLDALDCICRYDSPDTLFYCDPPYSDLGAYGKGFDASMSFHVKLAKSLNLAVGFVAVSGYHHVEMERLYKGWRCVEFPMRTISSSIMKHNHIRSSRQECLWMNYDMIQER